jgi:hypothetical protein
MNEYIFADSYGRKRRRRESENSTEVDLHLHSGKYFLPKISAIFNIINEKKIVFLHKFYLTNCSLGASHTTRRLARSTM